MSCQHGCVCCNNQEDICGPVRATQLDDLALVKGKNEEGCERFEGPKEMICRIINEMATGNDIAIGDFLIGSDCQLHRFPNVIQGLLSVTDTPSVDLTLVGNTISADVQPQWVRNLFSVIDSTFIDLTYNNVTGQFTATLDPNAVATAGIMAALASLAAGAPVVYNSTPLVGADGLTHVVPPQTLAWNPSTRDLSISDGNTVNIEDKHIINMSIVGNILTIVRSDGVIFQQAIPMTLDVNVQSFTLSGGVLTILETDGQTHSITLPQDCCPVGLTTVGNNIVLTLSTGATFSAPLPIDVFVNNVSVFGNTLTISQTNGSSYSVVLPQVNVVSTNNSVNITTTVSGSVTTYDLSVSPSNDIFVSNAQIIGNNLVITRNDGQVWSLALPTTTCASILACFSEGQNIDIQPTGLVSAGYLRDNGDGTYTWINQDGNSIFTFSVPGLRDCSNTLLVNGENVIRCPVATTQLLRTDNALTDDNEWHFVPLAPNGTFPDRLRGSNAVSAMFDYRWADLNPTSAGVFGSFIQLGGIPDTTSTLILPTPLSLNIVNMHPSRNMLVFPNVQTFLRVQFFGGSINVFLEESVNGSPYVAIYNVFSDSAGATLVNRVENSSVNRAPQVLVPGQLLTLSYRLITGSNAAFHNVQSAGNTRIDISGTIIGVTI